MRTKTVRRATILALSGALALSACAKSSRDTGNSSAKTRDVIVFAASADPTTLDPAFASDGETFRVTKQIYEGLIDLKPGTTKVVPRLATSWDTSADGKAWTFHLRTGVTFTDGTPFNAAAVCANFDRWYNWKGLLLQNQSLSYYWQTVFGGFATTDNSAAPATSLYKSCQATDDSTAVINLTSPSSAFLPALSVPAFGMQSPTALAKYGADKVTGTGDAPKFAGTYWDTHPTGTGPYKFSKWQHGTEVDLVRNDSYWGAKAKTKRLVFVTKPDNNDRKQSLQGGTIDGYDNVDPGDIDALKSAGFQVDNRAPFSLGYIGFNMTKPPMNNLKIRQAFAYAVNRQALVTAKYPPGAQVAKEFLPKALSGYTDNVPTYSYDPNKAKQLIAASGVKNPTIEFAYPTDVSRPYMPVPQDNWSLIKADLENAGFTVKKVSAPWSPDYLRAYQAGNYQAYLIGWNADYADTDDFLGVFFRDKSPQFGWDDSTVRGLLAKARAESDPNQRASLYEQANKEIMTQLPGLPYVLVGSSIALAKNMHGFVANPVTGSESFATVTVG
ncbi:MAG TPA: ABC transporter substrate-binding protein [Mycobacteriales bacterium]|nr:ABC transporter substrate-binding protein [Mycobacteriales bacterium]